MSSSNEMHLQPSATRPRAPSNGSDRPRSRSVITIGTTAPPSHSKEYNFDVQSTMSPMHSAAPDFALPYTLESMTLQTGTIRSNASPARKRESLTSPYTKARQKYIAGMHSARRSNGSKMLSTNNAPRLSLPPLRNTAAPMNLEDTVIADESVSDMSMFGATPATTRGRFESPWSASVGLPTFTEMRSVSTGSDTSDSATHDASAATSPIFKPVNNLNFALASLPEDVTPIKHVLRAHRRSNSQALTTATRPNASLFEQALLSTPTSPVTRQMSFGIDPESVRKLVLTNSSPPVSGPPKKQLKVLVNDSDMPAHHDIAALSSIGSAADQNWKPSGLTLAIASPHVQRSPIVTPSSRKMRSTFPGPSDSAERRPVRNLRSLMSSSPPPATESPSAAQRSVTFQSPSKSDGISSPFPSLVIADGGRSIQCSPEPTLQPFHLHVNDVTPVQHTSTMQRVVPDFENLPLNHDSRFSYDSDDEELRGITQRPRSAQELTMGKTPFKRSSLKLRQPHAALDTECCELVDVNDANSLLSPIPTSVLRSESVGAMPVEGAEDELPETSFLSPDHAQHNRRLNVDTATLDTSESQLLSSALMKAKSQPLNHHRPTGYTRGRSGSVCISGMPSALTPRSNIQSQLTPDVNAFNSSSMLMRKGSKSRDRVMPPTPQRIRPHRPHREGAEHDTLAENKLLLNFAPQTGNAAAAPERPRFEVDYIDHAAIGRGTFFEVFRVREKATGQFAAIKRSVSSFRSESDKKRYLEEMETVHALGAHPNIVSYVTAWQEAAHLYIKMEYCPMNLLDFARDYRRLNGCVDDDFLANVAMQISSGLAHVHAHNTLHLDIKPENILCVLSADGSGQLKLGDFGAARLKSAVIDGAEGDCQYMAPELLGGNPQSIGGAADMFSLGLLLLELGSNVVLPKSGEAWQELRHGGAAKYIAPTIGAKLRAIILALLNEDPTRRSTAQQCAVELARWHTPAQKVVARRASTVAIIQHSIDAVQPTRIPALDALQRRASRMR